MPLGTIAPMKLNAVLAFVATLALNFSVEAAPSDKRIAITIDDLPLANQLSLSLADKQAQTERLLAALRKHQVPAIGFVNEDKLLVKGEVDGHVALLQRWLDAGMELGNHGFGHLSMHKVPLEQYQDAAVRGDTVLRSLLAPRGQTPRYWRHPFLQTGKSEEDKAQFEAFLARRGYQVAPVTIEHDDWMFACVYERSDAAGKQRTLAAYLPHLDLALDAFERMSQELFGRQIAQVFLIHANEINADSLDLTLQRLRDRGYRFITLDEALTDPAYASPTAASRQYGPSWLSRWARAASKKLSVYGQPDPTGWVAERHAAECR